MTIYIDGLERSGNVYLTNVLQYSFQHKIVTKRDHIVSTLKNYKGSDPFIVPVRDALDSIASAKVFRDYVFNNKLFNDTNPNENKIENIIKRYSEYMDYLVENPKFFIAPFNEFTNDHNMVVSKIISFFPEHEFLKNKKRVSTEYIFSKVREDEYSHHPELGNFPRQESEQKNEIKCLLFSQYGKEIQEIQDKINILYQRYYDIEVCYNLIMENTTDLPKMDLKLCCEACTCTNSHSSTPPTA